MSSIPTNTTDDAKKAKTKAKSQSMPSRSKDHTELGQNSKIHGQSQKPQKSQSSLEETTKNKAG
jgi:hypothetical protein